MSKRVGYWWGVRRVDEEFACPECAQPVQADDPEPDEPTEPYFGRAWHDGPLHRDFCSVRCAVSAESACKAGAR